MFAGAIKLVSLILAAHFFAINLGMGLKGVWWTLLLAYGVEAVTVSVWYFRGKWRTRGLTLLDNLRPKDRT
jgi:Na+-driven multidrug efflux pump